MTTKLLDQMGTPPKAWDIVGGDFCLVVRDFFATGDLLK
jgi:hypothetical protein